MSLINYNYIEYLNNFYKLVETKPITSKAQCLYNALLHCFNCSYWKEELELATRYLLKLTTLSNKMFYTAREELHILNLINYTTKKGRNATIYKLTKPTAQQTLQKTNINYISQEIHDFINKNTDKYKTIGNFVINTLNTACNENKTYSFNNCKYTNIDFIKIATQILTCDNLAKICSILANDNNIKNPTYYTLGYFININK